MASDRRADLPPALLPSACPECEAPGHKQTKVGSEYQCEECGWGHDGGGDGV